MSHIDMLILGAYGLAAIAVGRDTRALSWLAVSAVVALSTALYVRHGFGNAAFVSALVDGGVCLLIYAFGRHMWEMLVWRFYQTFVLIHLIFLASVHQLAPVVDPLIYGVSLELLNILVALTIGGAGLMQRLGHDGLRDSAWRPLRPLVRLVRQKRTHPPFWAPAE
ncbi:hypothetical protein OF122_12880 [Pelagibacterium flavum]|uniref:Uncharacterized protein n=1 Tax=Pelagibacterium flavum TaxID=2984530 RepID=A0ABY6IK23_9HYPH|nr:hypothetical protein [Pelagibacterium sp. YIM 151497]UYQ70952.1 hypothetical protein OF122_12880 [Pelagibacterium sp. YIM 151497]